MNQSDLSTNALHLVRVADALQQFPELEHRWHSYNSIDDEVIVFEGDTLLTHDLILDFAADSWPASEQGNEVLGLIVTGDLVVDGAILNYDIDCSPFLIVQGNLRARTIDKGSSMSRGILPITWTICLILSYQNSTIRKKNIWILVCLCNMSQKAAPCYNPKRANHEQFNVPYLPNYFLRRIPAPVQCLFRNAFW